MSARGARRRAVSGQATVELVLALPLVVAVAFGVFALLAAGRAREQAGAAAHAAALAILQDRDPEEAAVVALPRRDRKRLRLRVSRTRVAAEVRPDLPVFAALLRATARADAGRRPSSPPAATDVRFHDGRPEFGRRTHEPRRPDASGPAAGPGPEPRP